MTCCFSQQFAPRFTASHGFFLLRRFIRRCSFAWFYPILARYALPQGLQALAADFFPQGAHGLATIKVTCYPNAYAFIATAYCRLLSARNCPQRLVRRITVALTKGRLVRRLPSSRGAQVFVVSRSAGDALPQSYGLTRSRAGALTYCYLRAEVVVRSQLSQLLAVQMCTHLLLPRAVGS